MTSSWWRSALQNRPPLPDDNEAYRNIIPFFKRSSLLESSPPEISAMNILYLQDHGEIGGAQLSLMDLLKGLRLTAPSLNATVVLGEKKFLFDQLEGQGIRSEVLNFPKYRKWSDFIRRNTFVRKLATICRENKIDVVHANTHQVAPWSAALGERLNLKTCCTVREIVDEERLRKYRVFDQDRLIAISEAVKKTFPTEIHSRSSQIYNCIQPGVPLGSREQFSSRWNFSAGAKLVGFMGKISERKGISVLIEAIPAVLRKVPEAHFIVIGTGEADYIAKIKAQVEEMKIADKISFCGELPDGKSYLHLLDVFVLPSFNEPLGRVTVEAMYAGVPVVGTDSGGTKEIVQQNGTGRLVPPRNSNALSDAIIFYLSNPTIQKQHGFAGAKRASELFSLENNARKVEKLYCELR